MNEMKNVIAINRHPFEQPNGCHEAAPNHGLDTNKRHHRLKPALAFAA